MLTRRQAIIWTKWWSCPLTHICVTRPQWVEARTKWSIFCRWHFKRIFSNGAVWIFTDISPKCVPKNPIDNKSASVQVMAWRLSIDKPLSEAMMTHFGWARVNRCVTRYIENLINNLVTDPRTPCIAKSPISLTVSRCLCLNKIVVRKDRFQQPLPFHNRERFKTICTEKGLYPNHTHTPLWKMNQAGLKNYT